MMECCLHYIYVNSLLDYIEVMFCFTKNQYNTHVSRILTNLLSLQSFVEIKCENVWVMYGMGFFMGQFFFLKYTVVYGLALTWSRAEGYQTPDPPKCIAYVYLYSDMWRDFDQPLYYFIKRLYFFFFILLSLLIVLLTILIFFRHIYEPCLDYVPPTNYLKKTVVSFLCFFFIYVWHGLDYSIFMWSFLNYCGVVVEMVARYFSSTVFYNLIQVSSNEI